MSSDLIIVGTIAGAYGVRGEVRIKSFCANPADIANYSPLVTKDGMTYDIALIGQVKGGFTAKIVNVNTKEHADALKGVELCATRAQLPDLDDDEYYYTDLIGMTVLDTGGVEVGKVKQVHNHGADDLLEVIIAGASDTALVPFTKAVVPTVDTASGRIVIDPPEGILP
ncbi:MAG: ribosome maturation factor RimM [Planktomarina sp.]